jgi:hypothetical protein
MKDIFVEAKFIAYFRFVVDINLTTMAELS